MQLPVFICVYFYAVNDCKFVCTLCSLFEKYQESRTHITDEAMKEEKKNQLDHTRTPCERHFKINGFSASTCDFSRWAQRNFMSHTLTIGK